MLERKIPSRDSYARYIAVRNIVIFLFALIETFECYGSSDVIRRQDQISEYENQRQREIFDQFRAMTPPKEEVRSVVPTEPTEKKEQQHFVFKHIRLDGACLLSQDQKNSLISNYLNKPITFQDINELLRDITNFYLKKGYVTTRAYLQPQNINAGTLVITVLEGKLGNLEIYENGKKRDYFEETFSVEKSSPLNMRDYEQFLDQINRLPSMDARMDFEPGEQVGHTNVKIDVLKKRPVRGTLSLDNQGSEQTGEQVIEDSLWGDDLLGLYDSSYLSVRTTKKINDRWKRSRGFTFLHSLPFGYWSLRFSASVYNYVSKVEGQLQPFRFSGTGQTYRGEAERIIHRDDKGKTGLSAGLSFKDTRSFVENNLLETSTYRLVIADFRIFHVRRLLSGVFNASLTYSQGTTFLGATKDESSKAGNSKAQFSAWNSNIGYYRPFSFLSQNMAFSVQGYGQISPHNLYGSERISLGGQTSVRGFKESKIAGDTGAYVQNELSWNLEFIDIENFKDLFGNVQAFVGYDMGWIHKDKADPYEKGNLEGGAVGIRCSTGYVFGEAVVSRSFSNPQFIKSEGTLFSFKIGANF